MALSDQQLAANISAVRRRTPRLFNQMPGAAFAAANSAIPVRTAQQVEAFRDSVFQSRKMRDLPTDTQYAMWGGMDAATQERLKAVGYILPHRKDPNIFEKFIGRPLGKVVSVTAGNVVEFANKGLMGIKGNIDHWMRAQQLMVFEENLREQGTAFPEDPSFWSGFTLSPDAWSRAWEKTKDGDTFIPFAEDRLRSEGVALPSNLVDIAKDAAMEFTEGELLQVYGQAAARAMEHPEFQKAVQVLGNGKISVGRSIAHGLGIPLDNKAFNVVSGATDAAVLWTSDPFNRIPVGKIRRAREVSRLVVDASDYRRLVQVDGNVQRAHQRLLTILQSGDEAAAVTLGGETFEATSRAAKVRSAFPQLSPLVDDLVEANPQSMDELVEFFSAETGVSAALRGEAPRMLSALAQSRAAVVMERIRSSDTIAAFTDQVRDVPGLGRAAKGLRRLVARVPKTRSFNPESKEAFEYMRQTALMALPKRQANRLMDAWSAASIGGKARIRQAMFREMRSVLDPDDASDLAKHFDELIEDSEKALAGVGRRYGDDLAGNELGVVTLENGETARFGVLDYQVNDVNWMVPDFRLIADAQKTVSQLKNVPGFGWLPQGWVNSFMDRIWRAGKVLTPSQGMRQGAEEVLGYMLEHGFVPTMKARLATSATKRLAKARSANEAAGIKYLASKAKVGIANSGVKVSDEKLVGASEDLMDLFGGRMLPDLIDPHNRDVMDSAVTIQKFLNRSGKPVRYALKPGGRYKQYQAGHELMTAAWQYRLKDLAHSEQAQVAIAAWRKGENAEDAMFAWLKSKNAARTRNNSGLYKSLRQQGMAEDAALREWARQSTEAVKSLTHTADGRMLDDVLVSLRKRKALDIEDLEAIPLEARPRAISGREFALVGQDISMARTLLNVGFDMIDKQMRWVSREPMMIAEYSRFIDDLAKKGVAGKLRAAGVGDEAVEPLVKRWAANLAADEVYKHIDDPAVRTQFAQTHRSLFPFWYAQDLFIRRWSSRMMRNPGVARRAQLTMMGVEHSGFVEDENGEPVFHYPVVGWAANAIFKPLAAITGNNTFAPIGVEFSGNLKYVLPGVPVEMRDGKLTFGFGESVRPGVGPIASIPLKILRSRFPELIEPIQEFAVGEFADSPVLNTLMPTLAVRFIRAYDEEQRASLMMNAMQYLDATGHDLPDDASAEDLEVYMERLRGVATTVGVLRGIVGSFVPGGARVEFAGDLSDEFLDLLKTLPIEQAMEHWIRTRPDGDAWTIFKTETVSGAQKPLSPTQSAGDFYKKHKSLFDEYGAAATWLLPSASEEFDIDTYRDQQARGLRRARTPREYWREMKSSAAADEYYRRRDDYRERAANAIGLQRDLVDQDWSAWSERYLAAHPIFAEHVMAGGIRNVQRQQTLTRLHSLLQDERVPDSPHSQALRQTVGQWFEYQRQLAALRDRRDTYARMLRERLDIGMLEFRQSLSDPVAARLFDANIRPDLRDEV